MKNQNGTQKWMTIIKNLKNTIKNIEQTMKTHKWSKGSEELLDRENIGLNA